VTEELVAAHAELAPLCPHVHLPVQSGSDRVLRRMIRRYDREDYVRRARMLAAARPGLTLSTDIIVGFPGETESDFEDTLSLVDEVGFVAAFGFKYSERPHTPARKLQDDVPDEVKDERLQRLFERVDRLQQEHLRALVDTRTSVLFEGPSKQGRARFAGRSERHEIVHVEVPAGVDLTGRLLEVRIASANKRSLAGELVAAAPELSRAGGRRPRALHLPVLGS
jgi:tRNA-2-methylthio-N6-dimethylallyladenosine synthase